MSHRTRPRAVTWICRLGCIIGVIALGSLVGCGGGNAAAGALPTDPAPQVTTSSRTATGATVGSASAGRTVFETNCEICHKLGDSEVGTGPRLVGANLTADAIREQVERPRDAMPPNLVSGADLNDVTAFILDLN